MEQCAQRARAAQRRLAVLSADEKNALLAQVKQGLAAARAEIEAANAQDVADAEAAVAAGTLSPALAKRLDLRGAKFETLLQGLDDVAALPDPSGRVGLGTQIDEGLQLFRVACPIGVLLMIFEARPEAAVQIAALSLKSGNAVLLKGGKEAQRTVQALVQVLDAALGACEGCVQSVGGRSEVSELLKMDKYIDLVIPRGSNELVTYIKKNTQIPVMGHSDGRCHTYIDESADAGMCARVVADAKQHYPAACNALETLLVHEARVADVLPIVAEACAKTKQFHADPHCLPYLPADRTVAACDADWDTEWCDLELGVKRVSGLDEAIEHINAHGSQHTDVILTQNKAHVEAFMQRVDSAGVYHNCSSRFADGFRYGFGAEVGISTGRLHARGPVGLEGLVTYKYRMYGQGHVAGDYDPGAGRAFQHAPLAPLPATTADLAARFA